MQNYKTLALMSLCTIVPTHVYADGQSVPINYDNLSYFEEPLAVAVGPATVSANLLLDQSVQYDSKSEDDVYNTRVNGQVKVETQLPNTWQVGATYVANYDRLADNDENDEYLDDFAVFVSDEWGMLAGGNVTESVREKTRRKRGFGNADLANDDFLGSLDEAGAYYEVRYNTYVVSLAADQEGRAEAGVTFHQPIGKSNYFASARLRKGDTTEAAGSSNDPTALAITDTTDALNAPVAAGETYGGAIVAQYTYASFLTDVQIGYETIDRDNSGDNNDHVFGSMGMQYKYGSYRFSAEGSIGRYDGQNRRAFALGSRIDIARGTSLNLGVNYEYANDDDKTTGIASVRYEL